MSQRVMRALEAFTPELEVYSIDEAFLKLDGFEHLDLEQYAQEIKQTIYQWTGLPVCVGIGPTKTLSKVANHIAEKCSKTSVVDLSDPGTRARTLPTVAVGDVWGIGPRWARKLPDNRNHNRIRAAQRIANHDSLAVQRGSRAGCP